MREKLRRLSIVPAPLGIEPNTTIMLRNSLKPTIPYLRAAKRTPTDDMTTPTCHQRKVARVAAFGELRRNPQPAQRSSSCTVPRFASQRLCISS